MSMKEGLNSGLCSHLTKVEEKSGNKECAHAEYPHVICAEL